MSRPIDADALIRNTILNPLHVPYITKSDVEDAPTIQPERKRGKMDAQAEQPEVIRCRECRWFNYYFVECLNENGLKRITVDDNYCSRAERRE